jgi:hypothetical protein
MGEKSKKMRILLNYQLFECLKSSTHLRPGSLINYVLQRLVHHAVGHGGEGFFLGGQFYAQQVVHANPDFVG